MLLKAVSSCLHIRRPSKGCPGNLTSCNSQRVTCKCLHSSNITNTQKNPPQHKEHLKCNHVEPYLGHQEVSHCFCLLPELWKKSQQADQVTWALQRGEAHVLGMGVTGVELLSDFLGLTACSAGRVK